MEERGRRGRKREGERTNREGEEKQRELISWLGEREESKGNGKRGTRNRNMQGDRMRKNMIFKLLRESTSNRYDENV